MTRAMQLCEAAVATAAANNVSQVQIDPDRAVDLYALWNSVFERSHEVKRAPDEPQRRLAHDPAAKDGLREQRKSRGAACPDDRTERHAVRTATLLKGVSSPGENDGAATRYQMGAAQMEAAETSVAARSATRTDAMATTAVRIAPDAGESEMNARVSSNAAPPSSAATAQAGSADSVSVFLQGSAVAIVVRDAAMSEQDAVRRGFETARVLTGQSAALAHITLNGRTVYQQHGEMNESGPRRAGCVLMFAC